MTRTVVVVEGDGIGREVVPAAVRVLAATGAHLRLVPGRAGADVTRATGRPVADDTLRAVASADAVLFGATTTVPGAPSAVLALRRALGLRVTVRPARSIAGLGDPRCDVTVVRELAEDLYVQEEREIPGGAEAVARFTEEGSRAAARLAFALARDAAFARVTIAHKATVLPRTQGLFLRVAREEAAAAGVAVEDRLADSLAHDMVLDPSGPWLVLAPNLFGDVLSDVASALAGGLGVAPSASFGDGPPLFEPVHGSAPAIAGKGIANPTAAILSAALMLDHLGERARGDAVRAAVERALADPAARTPDLGGRATTERFADAVVRHLAPEAVA